MSPSTARGAERPEHRDPEHDDTTPPHIDVDRMLRDPEGYGGELGTRITREAMQSALSKVRAPEPDATWTIGPRFDPDEDEVAPWCAVVLHWPGEEPAGKGAAPEHWTWELVAPDGTVHLDGTTLDDPSALLDSIVAGLNGRAALATTAAPGDDCCDWLDTDEGTVVHERSCPVHGDGRATTADTDPPPCNGAYDCPGSRHRAGCYSRFRAAGDHPAEPERPPTCTLCGDPGRLIKGDGAAPFAPFWAHGTRQPEDRHRFTAERPTDEQETS